MTTTTAQPNLWHVVIAEPLSLIAAQPHQALISVASVALMAQYAGSGGIVHPLIGYVVAIGVEWAYLRGLVSDSKAQSFWGAWLNWSAMLIVVLWGSLWCLTSFGALPEKPTGALAWFTAFAHVAPIAWLSLCSGMCHRSMLAHDARASQALEHEAHTRQRQAADERQRIELEAERKRAELLLWEQGQQAKARLKYAEPMPTRTAIVPLAIGKTAICTQCQNEVAYTTASEAGTIKRWGCVDCRTKRKQEAN
jgi:hypothetical protein